MMELHPRGDYLQRRKENFDTSYEIKVVKGPANTTADGYETNQMARFSTRHLILKIVKNKGRNIKER